MWTLIFIVILVVLRALMQLVGRTSVGQGYVTLGTMSGAVSLSFALGHHELSTIFHQALSP